MRRRERMWGNERLRQPGQMTDVDIMAEALVAAEVKAAFELNFELSERIQAARMRLTILLAQENENG